MIGNFAIGFLSFLGDEVFSLGNGAGGGFVIFVAHVILLGMILIVMNVGAKSVHEMQNAEGRSLLSLVAIQAEAAYEAAD